MQNLTSTTFCLSNFAGLVPPIIFLIILPSGIAILSFIFIYYWSPYWDANLGFRIPVSLGMRAIAACIFTSIAAVVTYGVFPLRLKKYISNKNYDKIVIEYEFVKNVFLIEIILLIILIGGFYISGYIKTGISQTDHLLLFSVWFSILFSLLFVVPSGLLKILIQTTRKEFRYYFAKGCCGIMSKKQDTFDKARYLLLALDSYDKYIRRRSKFGIADLKRAYAKFLYSDPAEKGQIIVSVCDSLESDKLKLARYLSTLTNHSGPELFISDSLKERLKYIGTLLAATIPVVVSVITSILTLFNFLQSTG